MKRYFLHRLAVLLSGAILLGVACRPSAETERPFVVADLFATPGKALATIALSATPTPSPTLAGEPTNTPAPTLPMPTGVILLQPTLPIENMTLPFVVPSPALTPTPLSCPEPPPMPFTPFWQNITEVQRLLRCPLGGPYEVAGVFQTYERGLMFWRQNDRSIFILSELAIRQGQSSDTWWRVDDTWVEGEPEGDPSLQPPDGLRQPIRGFGKVWRNNAFVRDALGWATSDEVAASSLWMDFEGGWMMTGPDGLRLYVLAPLDQQPPYSNGVLLGPLP